GSAFLAGPGLVVSCIHVCVPDPPRGKPPLTNIPHTVEFEYISDGAKKPVPFDGQYLPNESDPDHDMAVVEVQLPAGLAIPIVPLSLDDDPAAEVVALGFPQGQRSLRRVAGKILDAHAINLVTFTGGAVVEVLHIDTRGEGYWSDRAVRHAMSGGPILNLHTGTVVAIIEGKRPRRGLRELPE